MVEWDSGALVAEPVKDGLAVEPLLFGNVGVIVLET